MNNRKSTDLERQMKMLCWIKMAMVPLKSMGVDTFDEMEDIQQEITDIEREIFNSLPDERI